jgi:hypothetical protein
MTRVAQRFTRGDAAVFVRFVVGTESENAWRLTGVIASSSILYDHGELYRHESEILETTYHWLNRHLPCPPFEEKLRTGAWTRNAVSWFRPEAREPIRRIWDIISVLRDYGTPVRLVKAQKPGKVVYSDDLQVVAETPYWA